MRGKGSSLRKATLSFIGTIIGAGVFGLPIVFSRVGLVAGSILFWIVAAVVLVTHLLFCEVILSEKNRMRLPGYAAKEFGRVGFLFASVTHPLQLIGANLIYLVLGAEFLASIFDPIFGIRFPSFAWLILIVVIAALITKIGLKAFAKVQTVATWMLIAAMILLVPLLAGRFSFDRILVSQWNLFLAPFGVFLFALSGLPAVNEIVEIVGHSRRYSFAALTVGTLSAALLSWIFGISIVLAAHGASIAQPSDIALVLPHAWQWLIPTIGLLAVVTSYFALSEELTSTVILDFKVSSKTAWIIAMLVPFALVFVIQRDFISLVGLIGTVFGGLNGALIGGLAFRVLHRKRGSWRRWTDVAFLVTAVYLIGMVIEYFSPAL